MRIEIIIFIIAAIIIANIYTDGKYMKILMSGKKYYQMAAVAFAALMIYILIKKNPMRARDIMATSNEYIKYLPIDRNTSNMISPILDFTSKQEFYGGAGGSAAGAAGAYGASHHPVLNMESTNRVLTSGKKATKRSVSETKKKFVASRQGWNCAECKKMLNATFEVDHVKRLEYGGDNHVDNLRALCRECHGNKTMMENL